MIPKVDSPSHIRYFRSISLIGSLYKLLAKVLMGSFFGFMDQLISFNQLAFLKSGLLVDGVIVMDELVDLANKSKKVLSH